MQIDPVIAQYVGVAVLATLAITLLAGGAVVLLMRHRDAQFGTPDRHVVRAAAKEVQARRQRAAIAAYARELAEEEQIGDTIRLVDPAEDDAEE